MQDINQTPEDVSNLARGHKANISNPSKFIITRHMSPCRALPLAPFFSVPSLTLKSDTSDESKKHSQEVLDSLGGDNAFYGKQEPEKDPNRVAGGLKS